MKSAQPTIKAIIYDVDGLLLDTEHIYDQVMEQFAGRPIPPNIRKKMLGRKSIVSANILVDGMQLDITPEEYLEKRTSLFEKLFPAAQPMPGAKKILTYGKEHNIPQAAATSSAKKEFALKADPHPDLFSLLDHIITSDQVTNDKPDPDIFLAAAEQLGIEPQNCLVFEDAPSGIQAGKAAGMSVIAIPHPLLDREDVALADQILSSLNEFDPAAWGLPPLG